MIPVKALFRMNFKYVAAFLVLVLSGCSVEHDEEVSEYAGLTKEERTEIVEYVQKADIRESVGQLVMAGIPADINTIRDKDSADVDRVMRRQIGFVIPQGDTYYDNGRLEPDEYLSKVIDFNNAVQEKASKGALKLPVLVAMDFEGPAISPIRRGLITPPSALSLATTQDRQTLQQMGGLVGFQLKSIGVHILLGPVLDVYNIKQGNKNGLLDRSFAATADGVARTASHFMNGVRQSGTVMFAKHYPSHGAIETNPHSHKQIPKYEGSYELRAGELKPFLINSASIEGLMTSHIEVDAGASAKLATFSSDLVNEISRERRLSHKIIITDDLSEMGAIRRYMGDNKASFVDVAIRAFNAGHDVLMFAHLRKDSDVRVTRAEKGRAPFTVEDLEVVLDRLSAHIRSNPAYEEQFRKSLRKIVRLKVQVAKSLRIDPISMLRSQGSVPHFRVSNGGSDAIKRTSEQLFDLGRRLNSTTNPTTFSDDYPRLMVREAIKKSAVVVRPGRLSTLKLPTVGDKARVIFAADEAMIDKYRAEFSAHLPRARFFATPTEKSSDAFRKFEALLRADFPNCDYLIYAVNDESDADLLSRLRKNYRKEFPERVLIFLHASPAILDSDLIGNSSIIGTFTRHSEATSTNIEILQGRVAPRSLLNLPVNVGDGKYYSVSDTTWVAPADEERFNKVFSQYDLERAVPIVQDKFFLLPKEISTIWKIVAIATIIFLAIRLPRIIVENFHKDGKTAWLIVRIWSANVVALPLAVLLSLFLFALFFNPGGVVDFIKQVKQIVFEATDIALTVKRGY